jgi:hypothetical protein
MTLQEAILLLEYHNGWRRGKDVIPVTPTDLGIAIDIVIEHFKNNK